MNYREQLEVLNATKHVHRKWYAASYPDVARLGMDPAEHYLRYGAAIGRNPGKNFNTKFYLEKYPEASAANVNPLVYYWLYGKEEGHETRPSVRKSRVATLSQNLFSLGFTSLPLRDLRKLAVASSDAVEAAEAARELALWKIKTRTSEGYQEAVQYARLGQSKELNLKLRRQISLIELVSLFQLGRVEEARSLFQRLRIYGDITADHRLAAANLEDSINGKLTQINAALALRGIDLISFLDESDDQISLYDRLVAGVRRPPVTDGPKISVLLAAYEAEKTLPTALRSLQQQTWQNFEVLVLDDCSPTKGTERVANEFALKDDRIRYVRMAKNGGAYIARNRGLDLACGDLITIHDADDWSHPLKLEVQAKHLLENESVLGCTSEQARCTEQMQFTKLRGGGVFTVFNTSSFMWKTNPLKESLGYWDTVRFGADNEFIRRMQAVHGKKTFVKMSTGPLSFQREADTSITGDPVKGIDIGGYYGVRKEYLLAQEHYHAKPGASLKYRNNPNRRPFAVPEMMNQGRRVENPPSFDLVLFGDFRIGSEDVERALAILADLTDDYKVGLVEHPRYDSSNGSLAWDRRMRDLVDGSHISVLVFGDTATCTREVWLSTNPHDDIRLVPEVVRVFPSGSNAALPRKVIG